MKIKSVLTKLESLLLAGLLIFGIYSAFLISGYTTESGSARDNHLVLLAEQFSKGNVALSPLGLPHGDYVDYFGQQFLYFGPLPSAILAPFAAVFGRTFPQNVLGFSSILISLLAVYSLSKRLGFNKFDALWLTIFFCFSTVFFAVSVLNLSAYQVQSFGAVLILLMLAEFFGKKRYLLIGILIALAGMTRLTLYLSVIFPLLLLLRENLRVKNFLLLVLPIILSLILLGGYNYKRFHSVFETGYKFNVTLSRFPMAVNLVDGQFSFAHLPANLYSLVIKSPDPIVKDGGGFRLKFPYLKVDPWGIAIWFTSPLFLLLFRRKRDHNFLSAILSVLILAMPSLLYFGIGFSQFGYRYSLDFLPFLLIFLIPSLKPSIPAVGKILIVIGVLFNCLYSTSIWGVYPQFGIFK